MLTLDRALVLNTLIKHETLTLQDLAKKENLGLVPDAFYFRQLIQQLLNDACIETLNGTEEPTYTITSKGIAEGKRMELSIDK